MSKSVALLVTGKARSYLRTSTTLFCLSLCLISSYLVLLQSQYLQQQGDFTDNATVHLIRVTATAQAKEGSYLRFGDAARVDTLLDGRHPTVEHDVTTIYSLGFGIPDQDEVPRFVYGLDGEGARLLGITQLSPQTLYSAAAPGQSRMRLDVPVVQVDGGGFSSAETVSREFAWEGGVPAGNPLAVLGNGDPAALYVTSATFQGLTGDVFGVDWATFQAQYDRENVYGSEVVSDIFVHVGALDDVKPVALTLEEAGYSTSYTLEAFDDLAGSLSRSALLGLLAVLAAFFGCLVYVLLSLNSYLKVSHEDMAILRHAGFSAERVAHMYSARVLRMFTLIGGVTAVYQLALAAAVLRTDGLRFAALNLLLCALVLGGLAAFTVRVLVRRHTGLDVLTLLRANREFE